MHRFDVTLKTPLGTRKGELRLDRLSGPCTGALDLLQKTMAVTGAVRPDGTVHLTGKLCTLLKEYDHSAEGWIRDGRLFLTFLVRGREMKMQGLEKSAAEEKTNG